MGRRILWDCCQFPSKGFEPQSSEKLSYVLGKTVVGGMGKFGLDLLPRLIKYGYEVDVVAEEVWEGGILLTPPTENFEGCDVKRVSKKFSILDIEKRLNQVLPVYGIRRMPPLYSIPYFLFSFSLDTEIVEPKSYDIAFFHEKQSTLRGAYLKHTRPSDFEHQAYMYHSTEVGRSGGIYHDGYNIAIDLDPPHTGTYDGNWLARDLDQLGLRAGLRNGNVIITNELITKKELCVVGKKHGISESYYDELKKRMFAVHLGVDANLLRRVKREKDTDKFTILFLGRLSDRVKNAYRLIEAVCSLSKKYPISVKIVSTEDYEVINKAVANFKLEDVVIFDKKWYKEEEKAKLYSSANLVFYATLYETFGIVPLEAMACRTVPLVGSGGPMSYIFDFKNGLIANPSDTNSIREKIEWAIQNEERLEEIGEAGEYTVRKYYDWNGTAFDRWKLLIENLMNGKLEELRKIEDGTLVPNISEFGGRKKLEDLEKSIRVYEIQNRTVTRYLPDF